MALRFMPRATGRMDSPLPQTGKTVDTAGITRNRHPPHKVTGRKANVWITSLIYG